MDRILAEKLTHTYAQRSDRLKVLIGAGGFGTFVGIAGAVVLGLRGRDLPLYPDAAIAVVILMLSFSVLQLVNEYLRSNSAFETAQGDELQRLAADYWNAVRAIWLTSIPALLLFIALAAAGTAIHNLKIAAGLAAH
jgi:hypothetical protein